MTTFVVKPCGTFGVQSVKFLLWINAYDHALGLIESGRYSRVMIGTESDYCGTRTYEPLGYLAREEGVLRWVAYAAPDLHPPARAIVEDQVRGYRNAVPCT